MAETLTTLVKLAIVQDIHEEARSAAIHFQDGGHGRLPLTDSNHEGYLRLARRSHERQHPVGVSFGKGSIITTLARADNDVPMHLGEEETDGVQVQFMGHDGIFHIRRDHPEFDRLHALLHEAIKQKGRIWFVAQKQNLALLDALPICCDKKT